MLDGEPLPDTVDLVERQLSGDFFCAPFVGGPDGPIHGWTANGSWQPDGLDEHPDGTRHHHYRLAETVNGATVGKTFTLHPGHPILYQRHRFEGGSGHLPIGHHVMIRVPGGARLSFSARRFGVTPDAAPETDPARGRSILKYPQRFCGLDSVTDAAGNQRDLRTYPFDTGHEDIVALAGDPRTGIGWSAALAQRDGFLFFAVKDAQRLPETLLWMSNGGRHYPPWNGRHSHVLGIEEVSTGCHHTGGFSSTGTVSPDGLASGLVLDPEGAVDIAYCFGAVAAPPHWSEVADIRVTADRLTLVDAGGDTVTLPFDGSHFGL